MQVFNLLKHGRKWKKVVATRFTQKFKYVDKELKKVGHTLSSLYENNSVHFLIEEEREIIKVLDSNRQDLLDRREA